MARRLFCFLLFRLLFFAVTFCAVEAQTSLKYQELPKAIIDLVDVRPTPNVEVSRGDGVEGRWMLIEAISGLPSIADLAQPRIAVGGVAIQSQNERTQPRALRDSFEPASPAGWCREAGCWTTCGSEDPLCGLGTGCPPRFLRECQRCAGRCRIEPVDRGCGLGTGAARLR